MEPNLSQNLGEIIEFVTEVSITGWFSKTIWVNFAQTCSKSTLFNALYIKIFYIAWFISGNIIFIFLMLFHDKSLCMTE